MAQAHWEIQGWMILILGWVFVPFYERSMVYTMPEFLEKRYNKESRGILTWLSLASYVLTKVSVTVLAGGLALNTLLGINFWVAALALVIITAIYTVIGGMESVLKTSVLQTPILLLGSLVILWLGLKELGGWNTMMDICNSQPVNQYGDTMTDLMRSGKDPEFHGTAPSSAPPSSDSGTGVPTSSSSSASSPARTRRSPAAVPSSAHTSSSSPCSCSSSPA